MKRRLFNLLAAVSLVICVAAAAFWVRSYFARDALGVWLTRQSPGRVAGLISTRGSMSIGWLNESRPPYGVIWSTQPREQFTGAMGFGWSYDRRGEWILSIPHWLVILVAAGLLWLAWRGRSRCAYIPGTCVRCGYDLRASKERCPECGMAIPAAASEGK